MADDTDRTPASPSVSDMITSLQSELPQLIGGVAADGSTGGAIAVVIANRLQDIKNALPAS
jgi:acetyl-CoA carboxylase alpha subunit